MFEVRFDLIKGEYQSKNEVAYDFNIEDKQITRFSQSHPLYDTVYVKFDDEHEYRHFYMSWDNCSGVEWQDYLEAHSV